MANVRIEFNGVMLFTVYPHLVEVLIPNCENLAGETHADGTQARPHFAWLTSPEPGGMRPYMLRESLIGAEVTIGDPSWGKPTIRGLDKLFPIDAVVQRIETAAARQPRRGAASGDRDAVGARIRLWGGGLLPGPLDKCEWLLDDYHGGKTTITDTPECVIWEATESRVPLSMELGRGATRWLTLTDAFGQYAISNLDHRTPEEWVGTPGADPDPEDVDFKWVYRLFSKQPADWDAVRMLKGQLQELPVPVQQSLILSADPAKCKQATITFTQDIQ